MQGRQLTATDVLALLFGVSGVLCFIGAARPMHPATPVVLLVVLGVVGLVVGGVLRIAGPRCGPIGMHVALGLLSACIGVLAWRSVTTPGIVGLGPAQLAVALYAGHFLGLQAARRHAVAVVGLATLGAWAAAPTGFVMPWVCLVVTVLGVGELQARLARHLRTAAGTDPLTGVANRRAWEADATRTLARAARTGEPVSIALLDLDGFKQVNDRHGHAAGDALLRELTDGWRTQLRGADSLGRYGGDEFVLCLPSTDAAGATDLLDRLAATHGSTWSTGTADVRRDDTLDSVLARADADLYAQKQARRAPVTTTS